MNLQSAPPDITAAFLEASPKQRALALALGKGMFGSDAMLEAGYTKGQAKKCDSKVVKHPLVVKLAGYYAQQAIAKAEVTVERAVEEMASIALFDPADIVDDENNVLPIKHWPDVARRAFAGWDSAGRPKFWSKVDATDTIVKIKGWSAPDKIEVKAVVGVVVVPSKGGAVIDSTTTTTVLVPPKG